MTKICLAPTGEPRTTRSSGRRSPRSGGGRQCRLDAPGLSKQRQVAWRGIVESTREPETGHDRGCQKLSRLGTISGRSRIASPASQAAILGDGLCYLPRQDAVAIAVWPHEGAPSTSQWAISLPLTPRPQLRLRGKQQPGSILSVRLAIVRARSKAAGICSCWSTDPRTG